MVSTNSWYNGGFQASQMQAYIFNTEKEINTCFLKNEKLSQKQSQCTIVCSNRPRGFAAEATLRLVWLVIYGS